MLIKSEASVHIVDEREKQQSHPTGRVPALLFAVAMVCTLPQPAEAQFTQQGYALVGTGAIGPANQGYSVSLSSDGNTAIVGGANDSGGFGAAWIFTRSSGLWAQQGNKLAGNGTCYDVCLQPQQGYSVALSADGNTALMGAPGDVVSGGGAWVYVSTNGVWSLQQGNRASVPYLSGTDYSVSGVTSAAGGLDLAGAGRSRPGKVAGLRRMGGLLPRQWPGQRSDIRDLTAWRWLFMGRYGNRAGSDRGGSLWLGTEGYGVGRLDARTGQVEWFRKDQGLAGEFPASLVVDRSQRIWAATERGLFVAQPSQKRFEPQSHGHGRVGRRGHNLPLG
jgi:hypothetical protein